MLLLPHRSVVGRLRGTRAHIDALKYANARSRMHFQSDCGTSKREQHECNEPHARILRYMYARLRKTIASGCGITPRAPTIPEAALATKRVSRPRNCEGQAEFLASLTKTRRNLYSSECVWQSGPIWNIKETRVRRLSLFLFFSVSPSRSRYCAGLSRGHKKEGEARGRKTGRLDGLIGVLMRRKRRGTGSWKEAPFRLRFSSVVRDINGPMPAREEMSH